MESMRRSWLVWLVSIFSFFLTVVLVITSGPAQEPLSSPSPAKSTNALAGLPKIETSYPSELSPTGIQPGYTDFTVAQSDALLAQSAANYQPREQVSLAHPSNYDRRLSQDAYGNPVNNEFIAVLHETVGSAMSALNLFQVNHPEDNDQVSYHSLITEDGTVIYVVPPEQRAFGAGNSVFRSARGEETVVTNLEFPGSVNNFAYHISLETPPDGRDNNSPTHSGYTDAQYKSLAWLLSRTSIPNDRITTHEAVDRSGSRMDPRSFEPERLYDLLSQYPTRSALR
jgi:hypothetical protein